VLYAISFSTLNEGLFSIEAKLSVQW